MLLTTEKSRCDSLRGTGIFLSQNPARTTPRPSINHCVTGLGRQERKADHSPSFMVEITNVLRKAIFLPAIPYATSRSRI
jgi:hypothetical protein